MQRPVKHKNLVEKLKSSMKKHKLIIRSLAAPKKKADIKWALFIVVFALIVSFFLSYFSNVSLSKVSLPSAFVILLLFIVIGILFDIVGISVTAADQKPFHSMAAKKVHGAKYALKIIRSASKVSNFCNDVIGDIAGIISGGTVIVIIGYFAQRFTWASNTVLLNLVLTSIVAALTIGGKALGKGIAMNYCNTIIFYVGLLAESIVRLVRPQALNRNSKRKSKAK